MKKYTDKDIENLKNDPFVKLLCAITGDPSIVDDAIKDLEDESRKDYVAPKCDIITKPKYSDDTIGITADTLLFTEGLFNSCAENGVDLRLFMNGFIYTTVFNALGEALSISLPYDKVQKIMQIDRTTDMKTVMEKIKTILND